VDDDIRSQFKRSAAVGGRYVVDHLNVVEGDGTCVAQEKDGVLRCGVVGDQTVRDCRGDILEIEGSESAVAKVVVDHRLIEIDVVWTAIAHPEERLAKDVGLIGRDEHTAHGKVVGWSVDGDCSSVASITRIAAIAACKIACHNTVLYRHVGAQSTYTPAVTRRVADEGTSNDVGHATGVTLVVRSRCVDRPAGRVLLSYYPAIVDKDTIDDDHCPAVNQNRPTATDIRSRSLRGAVASREGKTLNLEARSGEVCVGSFQKEDSIFVLPI